METLSQAKRKQYFCLAELARPNRRLHVEEKDQPIKDPRCRSYPSFIHRRFPTWSTKRKQSVHNTIPIFFLFLGSGPAGVDDLCFHTYGVFSPSPPPPSSPSLPPQIPVSRPKFQSRRPNASLEAQIPASWPKS